MPRELNLVPALRQLSRLIRVIIVAEPADLGPTEGGITRDSANPRMVLVRICEESRADRSRSERRERNPTKGLIIYEFQRKEGSKLSISKLAASIDLNDGDQFQNII
jgi:hypothetical protein